jgi:hypothetical protein
MKLLFEFPLRKLRETGTISTDNRSNSCLSSMDVDFTHDDEYE